MRFIILILMVSSLNGYGQTAIKSFSADTTGQLHWSVVVGEKDKPIIAIQRKVGENWITVNEWTEGQYRYAIASFPAGSEEPVTKILPPPPSIGSAFFPVEKGMNVYRMVVKNPDLISNEVSINRTAPLSKLTAKGDFINFDDYYCFKIMDANGVLIRDTPRANFLNVGDLRKGHYYIAVRDPNNRPINIYLFEK